MSRRQQRLHIVPLELPESNALVARWHRHHKPVLNHRFSLGCVTEDGVVVGAAIVGRPVARFYDQRLTVEVTRLVTDGTPNACSALYGAAARAAQAIGYRRIQTYILDDEPGTSLKAAGWEYEGPAGGGQWKHTGFEARSGRKNRTDQPTCMKGRWARTLNTGPDFERPTVSSAESSLSLFANG